MNPELKIGMCGMCYDEDVPLFPAPCKEDPTKLKEAPIGMYHCPECWMMVLAGSPHPEVCGKCLESIKPPAAREESQLQKLSSIFRDLDKFAKESKFLKYGLAKSGTSSLFFQTQPWYSPTGKPGPQIYEETCQTRDRMLKKIPGILEFFEVEASCETIYLTSKSEEE